MQSIFGALLAAGYASAFSATIAASPDADKVSSATEAALTKSLASAEATTQQFPRYSAQIAQAAKESFLAGDQWAYTAGIVAVLLGAALVFSRVPRAGDELVLLKQYQEEDSARS